MPKDSGYGDGNFMYWYFNYNTKTCEEFKFYGYGGNDNMFYTKSDCESVCGSYQPTQDGE